MGSLQESQRCRLCGEETEEEADIFTINLQVKSLSKGYGKPVEYTFSYFFAAYLYSIERLGAAPYLQLLRQSNCLSWSFLGPPHCQGEKPSILIWFYVLRSVSVCLWQFFTDISKGICATGVGKLCSRQLCSWKRFSEYFCCNLWLKIFSYTYIHIPISWAKLHLLWNRLRMGSATWQPY